MVQDSTKELDASDTEIGEEIGKFDDSAYKEDPEKLAES